MRTVRYADEVWTPTGIVDSIRFEDIPVKVYNGCSKLERNENASLVHIYVNLETIVKAVYSINTPFWKQEYV